MFISILFNLNTYFQLKYPQIKSATYLWPMSKSDFMEYMDQTFLEKLNKSQSGIKNHSRKYILCLAL